MLVSSGEQAIEKVLEIARESKGINALAERPTLFAGVVSAAHDAGLSAHSKETLFSFASLRDIVSSEVRKSQEDGAKNREQYSSSSR